MFNNFIVVLLSEFPKNLVESPPIDSAASKIRLHRSMSRFMIRLSEVLRRIQLGISRGGRPETWRCPAPSVFDGEPVVAVVYCRSTPRVTGVALGDGNGMPRCSLRGVVASARYNKTGG